MNPECSTPGAPHRRPALLSLLAALALAAACTSSVNIKIDSEVPVPTVARIPLAMGVHYDAALREHVYTEDSEDRPDWSIESGASQVQLFDRILPAMFQSTVPVEATDGVPGVAGIIAPHVAEMQFALPTETKTDFYEAWIKYQMQLFDADGQLVAEWPVTGYGKAETAMLKSKDDGLSTAINLAMRDAGAKVALGFERVQEVRRWLALKTKDCERYGDSCQ